MHLLPTAIVAPDRHGRQYLDSLLVEAAYYITTPEIVPDSPGQDRVYSVAEILPLTSHIFWVYNGTHGTVRM
jgi:hypothetical protein